MDNDTILCKVIAAEKEIRKMIEDERERAREVVAKVRKEGEDSVAREEDMLRESLAAQIEKTRKDAEKKAAEIKDAARVLSGRLECISDDRLQALVMDHLVAILPGHPASRIL